MQGSDELRGETFSLISPFSSMRSRERSFLSSFFVCWPALLQPRSSPCFDSHGTSRARVVSHLHESRASFARRKEDRFRLGQSRSLQRPTHTTIRFKRQIPFSLEDFKTAGTCIRGWYTYCQRSSLLAFFGNRQKEYS